MLCRGAARRAAASGAGRTWSRLQPVEELDRHYDRRPSDVPNRPLCGTGAPEAFLQSFAMN